MFATIASAILSLAYKIVITGITATLFGVFRNWLSEMGKDVAETVFNMYRGIRASIANAA